MPYLFCNCLKIAFLFYRAIDINALIGTIGGYIGLFLGYSLLQFPNLVIIFAKKIKEYDLKGRLIHQNEAITPDDIQIAENVPLESNDFEN